MRIIAIILILSSIACKTIAQTNKYNVTMRVGYALPMGEFASHDFGYGGYALLGKTIGIEGIYYLTDKIGVGADISYKEFRFASGYFLLDYITSEPAFSSLNMLSTNYTVKSFYGGGYYRINVTDRFSANCKLMGGVVISRTPDQLFTGEAFSVGKTYFWKTSARSVSPAVLSGINLSYRLFEHIDAGIQFDFSYTRAKYTFIRGNEKYYDYLHIPLLQLIPGITVHW